MRAAALALLALFAGGCCLNAPAYHGPRSDHFDGKRFHEPGGESRRPVAGLLKWMLHRKHRVWHDHRGEKPGAPPPVAIAGSALRVTFVNHSTVLVQCGGLNVLTDPIWSTRAGPFAWAGEKRKRAPGIRFQDLPKIDVVVLSHDHYDHLDLPTLERLEKRDHPQFFTPLGNAQLLAQHGIAARDLDWWDEADLGNGSRLVCVPARHFSGRGMSDYAATLWSGWLFEFPAGRVYFAGDTGYGPHFAEIARRAGPLRLALLPIGSYEPRWFMKPVHENPADAVRADEDLGGPQAVPIHYGAFDQTDEGEDAPLIDLRSALEAAGVPEERFHRVDFGEGFDVPLLPPPR